MLFKYYQSTKNINIKTVIPELLENYNDSFHSTLNDTPNNRFETKDITNYDVKMEGNERVFKIGDHVRVAIKRKTFDKEGASFSREIYVISGYFGTRYVVKGVGRFKENELQLVNPDKVIRNERVIPEIIQAIETRKADAVEKRTTRSNNNAKKDAIIEVAKQVIKKHKEKKKDSFIVESIIECVNLGPKKGKKELKNFDFKVRWKGYGPEEDLWIPYEELKNNKVFKEYIKKNKIV